MKVSWFSVLLLVAGGCGTGSAPAPTCEQLRRAPAALLAYWYFPKGSYWVYRKRGSQPLEVDTLTVIAQQVRVFEPGQTTYGLPTCTELYEQHLWHSNRRYFRGYRPDDGYRGYEHLYTQEESGEWFVTQSADNRYDVGFLWSSLPKTIGQPIANTGPTLLDTIPVTVPAGTLRRSFHLTINAVHDSTRGAFLRDYYLTRGVGYTRLRYANLGTWELVSYYISPR